MYRTSPMPNDGRIFEIDPDHPVADLREHRYSMARCLSADGRADSAAYLLVECVGMPPEHPQFQHWLRRFEGLRRQKRSLHPSLLQPLLVTALPNGNAGWIARFPEGCGRYHLAKSNYIWRNEARFAELFAFGCMAAAQENLPVTNLFVDEERLGVLSDTSPTAAAYRYNGVALLHRMLTRRASRLLPLIDDDPRETFRRLLSRNDLQAALDGTRITGVRIRMTLRAPKSAVRSRILSLSAEKSALDVSEIFPELPRMPLMAQASPPNSGFMLENRSRLPWNSSRYCGQIILPGGRFRPRTGEVLSVNLPLKHRLQMEILGFDTAPVPAERDAEFIGPARYDFASAAAAPPRKHQPVPLPGDDGFLAPGDPALPESPAQTYKAAADMMQRTEQLLEQGLLPARFAEDEWLIDPARGRFFLPEDSFTPSPDAPMDCTLGYAAPEGYAPDSRPTRESAAYAAAVWLYRLLVGGYPLEGRRTRAVLAESGGEEEAMAAQLYGDEALFVFDSRDPSNSLDGLPGPFARQTARWNALPDALRRAFIAAFGDGLRDPALRPSPGRWAALLRQAAVEKASPQSPIPPVDGQAKS